MLEPTKEDVYSIIREYGTEEQQALIWKELVPKLGFDITCMYGLDIFCECYNIIATNRVNNLPDFCYKN
jgi:hypothetical protein